MRNLFTMTEQELRDFVKSSEFDEFLCHTKARHINKCDSYLKSRLLYGGIKCASTFQADEKDVSTFLKTILGRNTNRVHQWLCGNEEVFCLKLRIPECLSAKKLVWYGSDVQEKPCSKVQIRLFRQELPNIGKRVKLVAFPQ
ncbi:hypothetical protein C818_02608 [Lachnospiraceae bacterium MD308]|nr:hypothetical protein C818_02608 [Lachnospiraceae bacterium MD308]